MRTNATPHEILQMPVVLDAMPSGLLIFALDGSVLALNVKGRQILNLPETASFGNLTDLPPYLSEFATLLATTHEDLNRSEMVVQGPEDKDPRTIGFSLKTIHASDEETFRFLVFTDITQVLKDRQMLERIQQDLFQSQKLASVGTMISGVVHELNNPLTGVSMSTDLTRLSLERFKASLSQKSNLSKEEVEVQVDEVLREVHKIAKASKKAAVLVSDLLTFSRPTQMITTVECMQEIIEESIQAFYAHPTAAGVKCQFQCTLPPIQIKCDKVKIEQVFYNLFKNAAEAMGGKGQIRVEVKVEDGQVITSVIDHGKGIPSEALTQIFEPFFTTNHSRGVGLGLSISHKTIEQHQGRLMVESIEGEGTTFLIRLPIYEEGG